MLLLVASREWQPEPQARDERTGAGADDGRRGATDDNVGLEYEDADETEGESAHSSDREPVGDS